MSTPFATPLDKMEKIVQRLREKYNIRDVKLTKKELMVILYKLRQEYLSGKLQQDLAELAEQGFRPEYYIFTIIESVLEDMGIRDENLVQVLAEFVMGKRDTVPNIF